MKLKQLLSKKSTPSPEGGYTIIESLVAMIMVAALMVAVAPIVVFSVGTRVQARRIELGAQAARSYIDSVRSGTAEGPGRSGEGQSVGLDKENPPNPATSATDIDGCNDGTYCDELANKRLYCVDGDGDGKCKKTSLTDMIVQAVSKGGDGFEKVVDGSAAPNTANYEMGYQMLVRVYRADAFLETTLEAGTQQSAVTNAIGNRRLPLVEMITEIGPKEDSFNNLRDRLEQ